MQKLLMKNLKEVLYQEFIDNILTAKSQQNISDNFDLTPIVSLLAEELKNTDPNGRVVIDLLMIVQ